MAKYKRLKELAILYVEDEMDVMEEIIDMLQIKVGKLYTAINGQEGLDIYNQEDIDIIISDIQMPVMDGMTMIKNIREVNESIPIVITTAFNEIEFLNQAIDLHVDKYITKPIDMMQLLSVLDRASEVVFQKREIEQRDKIIQTILDMRPYYSLIADENNIEKLNLKLLSFLGDENKGDFSYRHIKDEIECENIESIKELTQIILNLKKDNIEDKTICLQNENNIRYLMKPYFFPDTHLFLLSFFEYEKVYQSKEFEKCVECFSADICKSK